MPSFPEYRYQKLRSGYRIIILERGDPSDNRTLHCRLNHISSLDDHDYEALSYAWGTNTSSNLAEIRCNGLEFWIQPNLEAALKRLRSPDHKRVIWVDAICINQADPSEKASQVLKMRDIYAKARQVIVWLGDDDESDKEAFDFLNWLATSLGQNEEEDHVGRRQQWLQIQREKILEIEHTIALLQRPWFTSTWVVQEVASAQKAILVYGRKTISWEHFWTATSRLWDPLFEHSVPLEIFRAQRNIWAIESAKRSVNGMSVLSLHKILLATHFNDCSDPRDKIFAVLGLATDWLEKGGLDPDYRPTTTAEDVFKRYAIWDVKNNRSLRLLSFATGRPETSHMPSWAPDWRIIYIEDLLAANRTRTKFSASKDRDPDAWFSDHGRVLNAVGQVVDTIKVKGPQARFSILRKMFAMTDEGI